MPRKKLNETLDSLHEQLRGGLPLDDADRTHLTDVLRDIAKVLDEDEPHESVGEKINEAVARFETSHPAVSVTLHEIVELLKRL